MLGYDLQWVNSNNDQNVIPQNTPPIKPKENTPRAIRGWVPTVHNFSEVIKHYMKFRQDTNFTHKPRPR